MKLFSGLMTHNTYYKYYKMSNKEISEIIKVQEVRSKLMDYVNSRITELSKKNANDEYQYSEKLGQIKELENILKFSRELS